MNEVYWTVATKKKRIATAWAGKTISFEEAEANAHLVAAAPKLLEALERITCSYEKRLRELGYSEETIGTGLAGTARVAIAEAKGLAA